MTHSQTVYQQNGYKDREQYLNNLREEYGWEIVDALTDALPESEDFDGLITELNDYREMGLDNFDLDNFDLDNFDLDNFDLSGVL
jgi:hypothetical protein